jgi:hypothetical protein
MHRILLVTNGMHPAKHDQFRADASSRKCVLMFMLCYVEVCIQQDKLGVRVATSQLPTPHPDGTVSHQAGHVIHKHMIGVWHWLKVTFSLHRLHSK